MKTKKTYTILNILICLFVLNILFSCQNGSDLQEPTSKAEYTTLYVSIDDSERTVMPEKISLSNLSFKLFGSKTGETQEILQTWNNSTDIPLSAITLKSGTWVFTMNAYSAGKLVLTSTKENVFLQGESKTIKFDLDEPNELLGSIDVTFEFPVGSENIPGAKKIVTKLIQDSDKEIEVDSQILIPEDTETDNTKQFVRYQKLNIEEGYYFLRFYIYQLENADYTNFHSTYIRVEPGLESKGKETITTLDSSRHKLTLDLNGGTWNENVVVPTEINPFESLSLPIECASFISDYWTNATLDGWYEMSDDGNLSKVPIISNLPVGITEDKLLIAKWTVTCESDSEIKQAFDNFPTGKFGIKVNYLSYRQTYKLSLVSKNTIKLSDEKKYVTLDFSNAILASSWNGLGNQPLYFYNYRGSTSIVDVYLPNVYSQYQIKTFYDCNNLHKVFYSSSMQSFKISILWSDNGSIDDETGKGLFDEGVVIYCTDGEIIVPSHEDTNWILED